MLTRLLCWLSGWRVDLDGWIVRAKRATDPEILSCETGFVEESAIAVRTFAHAREIDRGRLFPISKTTKDC